MSGHGIMGFYIRVPGPYIGVYISMVRCNNLVSGLPDSRMEDYELNEKD